MPSINGAVRGIFLGSKDFFRTFADPDPIRVKSWILDQIRIEVKIHEQ